MARSKKQPTVPEKPVYRPKLFIGSSSEGLTVAGELQAALEALDFCEVTIWNQKVFGLGQVVLDELVQQSKEVDFAILVLTPDDIITSRDNTYSTVRDNILFELGLFMGTLGKSRTYMIHRKKNPPKIPSDFDGVVRATYDSAHSNLRAALNPASIQIRDAVQRELKKTNPKQACSDILAKLIDRLPQGIQKDDLALFEGHGLITNHQFIELQDKVLEKLQQTRLKSVKPFSDLES